MKQGPSNSAVGGTKREPISKDVSVDHVAQIGNAQIRGFSAPLYEGRGIEAPKASTTIHQGGSQGKHK